MNKIYNFFKSIIQKSLIAKYIISADNKIQDGIDNSVIVSVLKKNDTSDSLFNRIKLRLDFLSSFKYKIKGSFAFNTLNFFTENFLNFKLRYFGIVISFSSAFGLINAQMIIKNKFLTVISVLLLVLGILLLLFKQSFNELFFGSYFIKKVFSVPEITFVKPLNADKKFLTILTVVSSFVALVGGAPTFLILWAMVLGFSLTEKYAHIFTVAVIIILPFMPTMVMVALCLYMLIVLLSKIFLGFHNTSYKNPIDILVLIFAGVYCLGVIASLDFVSSLKSVLVYESFILFYFVITRFIDTKQKLISIIHLFTFASLPVSAYGIFQKLTGFDNQNTWVDTEMFESIQGRIVSFFENPNVYGEYLIIAIMVSLLSLLLFKHKRYKLISFVSLMLNFLCLILTYSRGCWIGVMVSALVFLLLFNRKLFLSGAVLGVASIPFWPESIITRITSVGNMADSSTSYRVYIWKGTLRMLKDYWLTGVGVGQEAFNKVYPGYSYSTVIAPHAHNLYLLIMSELGLVGIFSFLCLVAFVFKKLYVAYKNTTDKEIKLLSSGIICALLGFLVQGIFDNVWYNYRVFLLFWIFIAISSVIYNIFKKENKI